MMAVDAPDYMLTTVDNPFNPYTDYDAWYAYDRAQGYDTPGYLARIAHVSLELSEADLSLAIGQAIDEIVSENINGMYRKISPPPDQTVKSING
jgi:hypothetical protein